MTILVGYASKYGATQGIAERIFFGAFDYHKLSFPDRMILKALRAQEGDFRDWPAIDAWAATIARDLG